MTELYRLPLNLSDLSDSDCDEDSIVCQKSVRQPVATNAQSSPDLSTSQQSAQSINTSQQTSIDAKLAEKLSGPHQQQQVQGKTMESVCLSGGIHGRHAVPRSGSRRQKQRQNRIERAATAGAGWFHLGAPETTEHVQQCLQLVQWRGVLDRSRNYKRPDSDAPPRHFALGRVVAPAADFYSGRLTKRERRATLVEELLADGDARKRLKRLARKAVVKRRLTSGKHTGGARRGRKKTTNKRN